MTPEEVKQLAYEIYLLEQANKPNHGDFHISAEQHYNDHTDLRELVLAYKSVRGLYWKFFFGLVVVGAFVLAAIGATIALIK